MKLTGVASSGLGRAHIFMAQAHYQDQFRAVLGATAWPGTLNLKVDGDSFTKYLALRDCAGIETQDIDSETQSSAENIDVSAITMHRIIGFEREGRSFGGASAFKASINFVDGTEQTEIACAILIPDLTRHTDVIEVIASSFLRESFDIVDGEKLIVNC